MEYVINSGISVEIIRDTLDRIPVKKKTCRISEGTLNGNPEGTSDKIVRTGFLNRWSADP